MAELANPLCWAARAIGFDAFGWLTTCLNEHVVRVKVMVASVETKSRNGYKIIY
jgi:hypothetical protein